MTSFNNNFADSMLRRIRSLSPGTEFTLVVLGAFGWLFVRNVLYVFHFAQPQLTEERLRFLLIYEAIALACLFLFLRIRGWTMDRLGLRPGIKDAGIGLLLAVASYGAWLMALTLFGSFSQTVVQSIKETDSLFAVRIDVAMIAVLAVVNPIFEETFVTGYVISALKDRAPFWLAVTASVVIRLSYHLYQGTSGLIGIGPLGLIFAAYYYRDGRLWPLIVAHASSTLSGCWRRVIDDQDASDKANDALPNAAGAG